MFLRGCATLGVSKVRRCQLSRGCVSCFRELAIDLMSQETICGSSVQPSAFHSWKVLDVIGYEVEAADGRERVVKV